MARIAIVLGAAVLWFGGVRLFLHSDLSVTRKVGWTTLLVLAGIGIGILLPLSQLWSKFLFLILILPVLGLADLLLLRSKRGVSFWIRACGFEVCTVFGVAAAARLLFDVMGATALVPAVK